MQRVRQRWRQRAVTIQSLPKKTRAATSAMSTIAVTMRFMCLVEDTWSTRHSVNGRKAEMSCLRPEVVWTDYNFFAFGELCGGSPLGGFL